jgi:hypothetical protein
MSQVRILDCPLDGPEAKGYLWEKTSVTNTTVSCAFSSAGEHLPYKQGVLGSNPRSRTYGAVAERLGGGLQTRPTLVRIQSVPLG